MARRRPEILAELAAFGELFEPTEAVAPILARPVRDALSAWLAEIWAEKDLAEAGLQPRRRAMFEGVPGAGKTTLAHHLCGRLGLRMVAVQPETIIDCWMGSSSRNLGRLFELVRSCGDGESQVVILFDEFDSLATKRSHGSDPGGGGKERNNVVNVLLQQIERHKGFIIAATNFAREIDTAVWRRFELHIAIAAPGQEERERILARYLAPYGLPQDDLSRLAEAFETASPALMRAFCEGLKRNLVLGPRLNWDVGRAAVIDRLTASIAPHPEAGKPRLWSLGAGDPAVQAMPWPPPLAAALPALPPPSQAEASNVIELHKGTRH